MASLTPGPPRDRTLARFVAWGAASGACACAAWGLLEAVAYFSLEVKLKGLYVESMSLWEVARRLADPLVLPVAVALYGTIGALAGAVLGGLLGSVAARRRAGFPPPSTLMPALGACLVVLAVCEWVLFQRRWGAKLLGLALVPFLFGLARAGELGLRRLGRSRWARLARRAAACAAGALFLGTFALALLSRTDAVSKGRPSAPAVAHPPRPAVSGPKRPHVVLVVLDTARADRFSAYGAARETSPRINAIAREGVLFENAFTVAPWTLPAHASLFTGLYPSEHGCHWGHQKLLPDVATLAEALGRSGYRTACFTNNPWIGAFTGLDRGFDEVFPMWKRPKGSIERLAAVRALRSVSDRYPDEGAAETNRVFERWLGPALEAGAPLFVFFNYMELHDPNWPAPGARRWSGEAVTKRRLDGLDQNPYRFLAGASGIGPEDLALIADLYDGALTYLDERVGEMVEVLRGRGILDDTLLVLTGDHGENLGDHGLLSHVFSLADSILRVPLVVRYPPRFPAGLRAKGPVEITDVTPTVLEAAGLSADSLGRPLSGRSLLGAMAGEGGAAEPGGVEGRAGPGRLLLAENYRPRPILEILKLYNPGVATARFDRGLRAARQGSWKYLWWTDGQEALYDLSLDPGELRDVRAERPDEAGRLGKLLAERLGPMVDPGKADEIADPEARERLRALGYVK